MQSSVFDDLAHQIVHSTTLSLTRASALIPTKPPKSSSTDPALFLLKQLLILKQQIVAFDIEYVPAQADINFDFSNITNTFFELRERGGLFNPGNLLRLVGGALVPRIIENMLDAKAELDARLRGVIHDFVNAFAATMTAAIPATDAKGKSNQKHSAFEDPAQAATAVQSTRTAIETSVPLLRTKLDEYLDDARVKETLIAAVEDQVLQSYEEFFDTYTRRAGGQGNGGGKNGVVGTPGGVSRKGKGREGDVWDPDTFAEWTGGVFGVRLGGGFGLGIVEDEGDGD